MPCVVCEELLTGFNRMRRNQPGLAVKGFRAAKSSSPGNN